LEAALHPDRGNRAENLMAEISNQNGNPGREQNQKSNQTNPQRSRQGNGQGRLVSEKVTAFLAAFEALSDQEKQQFFRQSGLVVLLTSRRSTQFGVRLDPVKYQEHLNRLLYPLSYLLNTIDRFRALISGGRATPTQADFELLSDLAVKGFDEAGRPLELRVFEEIVESINAKTKLIRDREVALRETIPDRRRNREQEGRAAETSEAPSEKDSAQSAAEPAGPAQVSENPTKPKSSRKSVSSSPEGSSLEGEPAPLLEGKEELQEQPL
jgi:hypothetical protein